MIMAKKVKEYLLWLGSVIGSNWDEVALCEQDEIIVMLISVIPLDCSQMVLNT